MRIGRCFVCNKPSTHPNDMVIIQKSPKLIWRHTHCYAGSANWLRSERAKHSEFTSLFTGEKNLKKTFGKKRGKNVLHNVGYNRKSITGPDTKQVKRAIQERNRSHRIYKTKHRHKILHKRHCNHERGIQD